MLDQTQVTQALTAIDLSSFGSDNGANQEAERLLPAVYDELRAIASGYLRQERVNHTRYNSLESALDVKLGRNLAKPPLLRSHRGGPGNCGGSLEQFGVSFLSTDMARIYLLNVSQTVSYQSPVVQTWTLGDLE